MRMLKRYVRIPGHEGGTCYRGKNGKLASDKSVVKKKASLFLARATRFR